MSANEMDIGMCPRCGRELVRGTTPTGKVCFRCPSCGGVAVTLPALRESIGAESIAVLTNAARAAERTGCACPGCGGDMSLLKVGAGSLSLSPYRDFWILSEKMAQKCGFDISRPLTAITFPFVQASGWIALIYAFFLFVPLAVMERRMGHRKFVQLFLKLMAVTVLAPLPPALRLARSLAAVCAWRMKERPVHEYAKRIRLV